MADIEQRHVNQNGLCGWCCCEWPCDAIEQAALADQLAEALRCYMGIGPLDDDQRVAARHALAAYEEARR